MQLRVLLDKPNNKSLDAHFEEHLKYYFQQGLVVYRWVERDDKVEVVLETPERIFAESLCDQRKSIVLLEKQMERIIIAFRLSRTQDVIEDLTRWFHQLEQLHEARMTLLDYCLVKSFGDMELKIILTHFLEAIEKSDWKTAAEVLDIELRDYFSFCRKDLDFCQQESGGNSVL